MVSVPKYHYKADSTSRVAICIPVRDNVTAGFALSLARLTAKCTELNIKTTMHMVMGSEVAMQRQQLVDEALTTNCTHILLLDSDMNFPSHTLQALLSHKKDIIACNYSTRVPPHRPVAFKDKEDLELRVGISSGIEEIYAIGMGVMLVNRKIYESITRPHFSVVWNNNYTSLTGEDVYFCNKAQEQGYTIWLENDLSKSIGHTGTKTFTIKGDCCD